MRMQRKTELLKKWRRRNKTVADLTEKFNKVVSWAF